jgi:hypothetical protein
MENGKKHDEQDENNLPEEKYKIHENESEHDDQYTRDQGEDENGPKPSADEQQ